MTDEPPVTAPDAAGPPAGSAPIRFGAQPTLRDLVWHGAELARRTGLLIALGTFVTVSATITLLLGDVASILGVLFGLSMLTGLFAAPFVWWAVRQRRDLMLAPVSYEIDDDGILMTTETASSRTAWTVYRRARETSRAFVLDTGAAAAIILLKRAMEPATVDAIRARLVDHGLLTTPTLGRRLRPFAWVVLGLVGVAVLVGGSAYTALNDGGNVSLETLPIVNGRQVTIAGTTDLPDGTLLSVQVFQLDAWNRALASNADAGDFPYIEYAYAVVQGGHFSAAVDATGWPAGHGMSAVYFWIDPSQPQAVIDRFGADGSGLHGSRVRQDEDTGPTLRVDQAFEIPE